MVEAGVTLVLGLFAAEFRNPQPVELNLKKEYGTSMIAQTISKGWGHDGNIHA